MDARHKKRIKLIQNLFSLTFNNNDFKNLPYPEEKKTFEIIKEKDSIDKLISKYALKLPIQKLAKVDLSILRWAVFELKKRELPPKVVIDEAVELAKELGGQRSYAFINAVLGKIFQEFQYEK